MKLATWHKDLVNNGPRRLSGYLACILFFPLSLLFGLLARTRVWLYRNVLSSIFSAPVPVVSIGNLAVGGTGKTPVTDKLLSYLLQKGIRVAVVSRGYGRKSSAPLVVVSNGEGTIVPVEDGGDEPVLLAQRNPTAIVIVSPDRRLGITAAVSQFNAELVLLDDGFQHLKVARDLDILLLDANKPFGNGLPLPLGNLREFPSAAERADIVLLTRCNGGDALQFGSKPVIRFKYSLSGAAVNAKGDIVDLQSLAPGRIGAFAGIADPESFFSALGAAGIYPVETLSFADHAVYGTTEKTKLHGLASRCDVLLTTEKDLVKLRDVLLPCDCLAVPLELVPHDEDADLYKLVDDFLDRYKERFMLSEKLLEMIACPKCKGEVAYKQDEEKVLCGTCKLAYPVRDGIPVMLVDEATGLD